MTLPSFIAARQGTKKELRGDNEYGIAIVSEIWRIEECTDDEIYRRSFLKL